MKFKIKITTIIILIFKITVIYSLDYNSMETDTLLSISQKYKIPAKAINDANKNINFTNLASNTKIIIPEIYLKNLVSGKLQTYIVKDDDSFVKIAIMFDTTVETLQNLNPHIKYYHKLKPGEVIIVSKSNDIAIDDLIKIEKKKAENPEKEKEETVFRETHFVDFTLESGIAFPIGFLSTKIQNGFSISAFADFNKYTFFGIIPRAGFGYRAHQNKKDDDREDYLFTNYDMSAGANYKYYFKKQKFNKFNSTSSILFNINMMQFYSDTEAKIKTLFVPGMKFQIGLEYLILKNLNAGMQLTYDFTFSSPEVFQNATLTVLCKRGFY